MAEDRVKRYVKARAKRLQLEKAVQDEGKRYSSLGSDLSNPPIRVVFAGMMAPMAIAQSGINHDGIQPIDNLKQMLTNYYNAQDEEARAGADLVPGEKAELDKMGPSGWKVARLLDD